MPSQSRPSPDNSSVVTFSEYELLTTMGVHGPHGVIGTPTDTPVVYGDSSGRQVKIRPNKAAWLRGHSWASDPSVDITMPLTTNTSGNSRIDRIVLRHNRATNDVTEAILVGTPSGSPVAPSLTQNTGSTGVYEISLARVTLANNYTTVAAANVQPDCWWLGSGGTLIFANGFTPPAGDIGQEAYDTTLGLWRYWTGSIWQASGAAMQFASYTAMTAAVTSPAEGMTAYLTDTDTNWFYKNGAWRLQPGQYLQAIKNTTTSVTNITTTSVFYTAPQFTIPGGGSASAQAFEVTFNHPVFNGGFVSGNAAGELQVAVNGGAYVSETFTGGVAMNAQSATWTVGKTGHLYKAGATDSTTGFRLRVAASGAVDVTASTSYPIILLVKTTGLLASEV